MVCSLKVLNKAFSKYGIFRFPLPIYIKIVTRKTLLLNGGFSVNQKCFQKLGAYQIENKRSGYIFINSDGCNWLLFFLKTIGYANLLTQ